MKVLFDGWPIVFQPFSPSAIHLLALLESLPATTKAVIAVPGKPFHQVPLSIDRIFIQASNSEYKRLLWEQFVLPRIAKKSGAYLMHSTTGGVPLFSSIRTFISPTTPYNGKELKSLTTSSSHFMSRIRDAFAFGAITRAGTLIWPCDLAKPHFDIHICQLPPLIHPAFLQVRDSDRLPSAIKDSPLPELFFLLDQSISKENKKIISEVWRWVLDALGDIVPLAIVESHKNSNNLPDIKQAQSSGSIKKIAISNLKDLALLYQNCIALFHPFSISPWGGSIRRAMINGKAIIGLADNLTNSIVGPGGYLVDQDNPKNTTRMLGAALITIAVEEEVRSNLSSAAMQHSGSWEIESFQNELINLYRSV